MSYKKIEAEGTSNVFCPECNQIMIIENFKTNIKKRYIFCYNEKCKNFNIKFSLPRFTLYELKEDKK